MRQKTSSRARRFVAAMAAVLVVPALTVLSFMTPAQAADPDSVSLTLTGCRLAPGVTLPTSAGDFICPDEDYTSGNLGKLWNELDLVPYRLIAQAGNSAPETQTYTIAVVLDAVDEGRPGYDVLSEPEINAGLSDATCELDSVGPQEPTYGFGGIDESAYRLLTLTQPKNSTCVLDYYGRLALGSHLFPGSALHANLATEALTTGGVGARDVSIPVKEIEPQDLSKDMTASQGTDYTWDVWKEATPTTAEIENTCEAATGHATFPVDVTVSWERNPATPGMVDIITHVYAMNPAHRTITVDVTDKIYTGSLTPGQGTLLDTATATNVDVPANTTTLVLTHTTTAPATVTQVNDVATATYTDKVTGIEVPGTTEATAFGTVQQNGPVTNATATVTDVEEVTGSGLSFSVDSVSGATGAFDDAYELGSDTTGPVSWTSDEQSGEGSVTFGKTILADTGTIGDGTLSDAAVLTGSDGYTTGGTGDAALALAIEVDTSATLTIDKTIDDVLQGEETATFSFDVVNESDAVVKTETLTFGAGQTSKSVEVIGLEPGAYSVEETPAAGFTGDGPKSVDLSGSICSGAVSFDNEAVPASAKVQKVTVPAGFEADWTFDLMSGETVLESVTTTGDGYVPFETDLGEGTYTVVENDQDGWASDGGSAGCTFTVDLPADAAKAFACEFTNTYDPSVTIEKKGDELSKVGDDVNYTITVTNTGSTGGDAGAPSLVCDVTDPLIAFEKTVTLAAGASDTSQVGPFTIPGGADDPFTNTAAVSCHYPGLTAAVATGSSAWDTNLFQPSITVDKTGPEYAKVGDTVTYSVTITNTSSADTPAMDLTSFSDTLVENIDPPDACDTLAPAGETGDSCSFDYTYTVKAGDGTSLKNEATAVYNPRGFPNEIKASDDHVVTVLHPAYTVSKTCVSTEPVPQEGPADFEVTFVNTGDAALTITAGDGIGTFDLAVGQTKTFDVSVAGPFSGQATADNTVTSSGVLDSDADYGVTWSSGDKEASASCDVGSRVTLKKLTRGVVDPSYDWQFKIWNGPNYGKGSGFLGGSALASGSSLNDADGVLTFGNVNLDPGKAYTVCEMNNLAGAGWTQEWKVKVDGSWVVVPAYNPHGSDTPMQNLGVSCVDFGAGQTYQLTAGGTLEFEVNNASPGCEPRTPGYWKNWSSCSGGGQWLKATGANDPKNEFWALDELLNSPGFLVGDLPLGKDDCVKAVSVLDQRDIKSGKKMASDAAYTLAMHYFAYLLNQAAGAEAPNATTLQAATEAQKILDKVNFIGTGTYLTSKKPDYAAALKWAKILDLYNNGLQ
ncbi:DUF7507 domain-containing protein [Nocardioides taihuensis]|uniref:DUF7507 domain-containing protein n=1 Tax=Nocardioides taihuensis TaxID=1835606 RepID=A0ABW0BIW8_9ACTN